MVKAHLYARRYQTMGVLGSGGGSLGLGGTKYDPTTWGGSTGTVAGGLQEVWEGVTGGQG